MVFPQWREMGKKNGQRRDEAKIFLKKSPAPKIVITASSDDSPDVDYLDNIKRSNGTFGSDFSCQYILGTYPRLMILLISRLVLLLTVLR